MKRYQQAKDQYQAFESEHGHHIETNNVLMHYLTWGKPSGIPVIWSHGSLMHAYELADVAKQLAKEGFYVIAIDYYGHGKTPIPHHPVSLYHIADDIKFLMDSLKIRKAILGGFSRGAYISTAFYDAYPEKVLGLILEDGGSVSANSYYQTLTQAALEKKAKEFDIRTHNPWDSTYDSEYDAYCALRDRAAAGSQFELLSLINRNSEGRWGIYSGLVELFSMNSSKSFLDLVLRPSLVPLFARSMVVIEPQIIFRNLNVPVLILDAVSVDDPMPFEDENAALQAQHPKLIVHKIYENTEHNIHYSHPKEFLADIKEFQEKIDLDHNH